MGFLKYLLFIVLHVIMILVTIGLSPILPAFAIGKPILPKWLSWFQTPDNPLDGDEGFITKHAPFKGQQKGVKQYINRIVWILRNPYYGLAYGSMGATIKDTPVVVKGNRYVSNDGNRDLERHVGQSGYVLVKSGKHFELYLVYQHGKSAKCFMARFGWKMLGFLNHPIDWPLGGKAQFVFSIKPMARFTVLP